MNLNVSKWKPFITARLFPVLENGKANQQMLDEGNDCFYVGAKRDDNGVMIHCIRDESLITKGNCIVFICNGQGSVGYANYMDVDFLGTTDIVAGYNEFLNPFTGAFLASVYSQERPKYSFGRKWKTHLKETEVNLPVKHNSDGTIFIDETHKYSDEGFIPDWQFMENYIKSLHHKPLTTKNKPGQVPDLKVNEWKEFRIGDLFRIEPTKGVVTDDLISGTEVPYMAAKHDCNGIEMICQKVGFEDWISKGNCIVFVNLGAGSAGYANYIKEDFIGMSGKTSCGYNPNLNEYNGLFVATVLCQERPKYSFGRSWTGDRLLDTTIKLPVTPDGSPDWQFMENYIKSLPYGDRLEG